MMESKSTYQVQSKVRAANVHGHCNTGSVLLIDRHIYITCFDILIQSESSIIKERHSNSVQWESMDKGTGRVKSERKREVVSCSWREGGEQGRLVVVWRQGWWCFRRISRRNPAVRFPRCQLEAELVSRLVVLLVTKTLLVCLSVYVCRVLFVCVCWIRQKRKWMGLFKTLLGKRL